MKSNGKSRFPNLGGTKQAGARSGPYWLVGQLCSVGLFLVLAGLIQGCRERPCVQSLALDEAVVIEKGHHKLAVVLREVPEGPFTSALIASVRNIGNTRYEGHCETLFSVSRGGTIEIIVAFTPKSADPFAVWKSELEKGRLAGPTRSLPVTLTLDPGMEHEFIVKHGESRLDDEKKHSLPRRFIGRLYAEE